jgi:serine/threonine protein phosphatase 1
MYYLIGDIHGYFKKLVNLFDKLKTRVKEEDTIIFLGDYIDRGAHSYEVIDFLISASRTPGFSTVFLKGNHEDMLMSYLRGEDHNGLYIFNGGDATIKSYIAHQGEFRLPEHHREFFESLRLYYEGEDFIAVHAGLDPALPLQHQDEHDLIWIREKFFRADKRWDKTVIFGHTPTVYISGDSPVYIDEERNIIGIDTGVIFGKSLSCLVWPERRVITG